MRLSVWWQGRRSASGLHHSMHCSLESCWSVAVEWRSCQLLRGTTVVGEGVAHRRASPGVRGVTGWVPSSRLASGQRWWQGNGCRALVWFRGGVGRMLARGKVAHHYSSPVESKVVRVPHYNHCCHMLTCCMLACVWYRGAVHMLLTIVNSTTTCTSTHRTHQFRLRAFSSGMPSGHQLQSIQRWVCKRGK
jgi:hypothetical protein